MYVAADYASLIQRYPDAVREVRAAQVRGRSVHKDLPGEDLDWGFSYSIRIEGGVSSLQDILNGSDTPVPPPVAPGPGELERRLADHCRRTYVSVVGGKGRAGWFGTLPPNEVPAEVQDAYRASLIVELAEEARWAALTPRQRDAEGDAALADLRGMGGFFAIQIPRPRHP
jgi:hypothetical protein